MTEVPEGREELETRVNWDHPNVYIAINKNKLWAQAPNTDGSQRQVE